MLFIFSLENSAAKVAKAVIERPIVLAQLSG
jgi:hypothetical protein